MIKGGAEGETNADCSRSGAGGEVQGVRGGVREMPPVKKSKKGKRKSKDGKLKIVRARGAPPALPPELRALDTEWWYAFLNKQVELGMHTPSSLSLSLSSPSGGVSLNSRPAFVHSTKSAQAAAPPGHYGGRCASC